MVFESLVVDLLNKYLGQYVENLDASQLKIGIWGGNVVLDNLELKDTALDDLDLPIKVVHGFLGRLTLSIPWKNLYNESTVVVIQDLHVLARPNFDIKYNEEKEEKAKLERKKQQILNIEEARLREEKKKSSIKKDKEDEDSFAEKLATNVIKNLQITIQNIHVRYEDSVSNPATPFSIGVTLENLSAQTTDRDFLPQVIKESVTLIHKLVLMDNLALYWNPEEKLKQLSKEEWLSESKSQIARKDSKPSDMKYILQPIVASKKLKINTKPGANLDIPKFFLSLVLEELGIVLLQAQYHGLVHLLESFERMNRNVPFRKYRPHVSLKGNAKIWWKYCMDSVLIEDIQRRSKMWKWENIQEHRTLCKGYQKRYKEKISTKSPSKTLLAELENMENQLNVVSITIFRSLAENEVIREKKLKQEAKSGGFFGFFSSKKKDEKVKTSSKIEELMGADKDTEMQKLYSAIGYSENEVITPFPAEYVANVFQFKLQRISITVRSETSKKPTIDVVRFTLDSITADLFQRPSANALKACVKIGKMKLYGTPNDQEVPLMIRNANEGTGDDALPLVDFVFETNPLNKEDIDQCINAVCQPLEIIYDANTVNDVIAFFEPPEDVLLKDLQEKAYSTFEDFKVSSTAGLLHAIDKRNILDVDIKINSSYLIIPDKGVLAQCTDRIVVDFGSFHIQSDPNQIRVVNPKEIDDINEVQEKAYDRFLLTLTDLQILLCREGEDLHSARSKPQSKFQVLYPVAFTGNLAKAILPQDPRLKQICVQGELSSLELTVSDDKLSRVVLLFDSLPLPKPTKTAMLDDQPATTLTQPISKIGQSDEEYAISIPVPNMTSISDESFHTPPDEGILSLEPSDGPDFASGVANQVKIELKFEIKKLKLAIALTDKEQNNEKDCVEIIIENIGTEVRMRRWDMFVDANIGRFVLREMTYGLEGEPLDILSTPKDGNMLQVSYRKCEFDESLNLGLGYFYSAEAQIRALHFKDEFQSTEQLIEIQVAMLYVILHQEALLSMMALIYQVLEPLNKRNETPVKAIKRRVSVAGSQLSLAMQEKEEKKRMVDLKVQKAAQELKEKIGVHEERKLKVDAQMDGLRVFICSSHGDLAEAHVKGVAANVIMQDEKMEVKAHMTDLQVTDNAENSKFTKIISMQSEQVFDLQIAMFENGSKGSNALNTSSVDTIVKLDIGQMRAVFLNRFVSDILAFLDHFEDAQKAILEAGKAARDKATAAVTEYSKHSSRHQLNVTARAPMVVIPVHSNSDLALLVDLGELHVFNSFKIFNKDEGPKNIVITDNITVKLSDLKLMKALIKDGKDIKARKELIKPMTLKLSVIRNLTPDNHAVPDVSVEGILKTITLALSEEDLSVALKVLQGNIAEGKRVSTTKTRKLKNDQDNHTQDTLAVPAVNSDRLASIHEEEETGNLVYENVRFKFELEKILLQVYLRPSDLTFEEEFLERDLDFLLSQFIIGHLDVAGTIMSDSDMDVSISLDTLMLDDMRPGSKDTLTRMIDNCPESLIDILEKQQDMSSAKMIEVKFKQSSKLDKNIEVKLCNLLCILNVEFLMVLMRTLLAAVPKEDREGGDILSDSGSPTHSIASSDEDTDASTSFIDQNDDGVALLPETRLELNVTNPQIVLLADAKDVKTNALFLTTEVNFQYLEVSNVQKMMGTVMNTAMLSTAFKKQHRTDISTVLSLAMVNLHSSAPIGGKPHMHVNMSLVKLNISPKTIRTVSACVSQTVAPPDEESLREAQKAMGQLWELTNIVDKKLWYLDTPAQHVLSAGSFVLARTEVGDYQNGFLAKKDTHFTVYFYPNGSISHSVSDVTSVVVDVAPHKKELTVGANVVAVRSPEHYRVGRIMEIWNNAGSSEQAEVAKEAGASDDDWELTKQEDSFDKYLIKFYHDNFELYLVSEELRLLPRPKKGIIPGLGACVYARYRDGFYYKGIVEAILGFKTRIHLVEIDDEVNHDMDDPSAVILNMTPRESQLKKYFKVIACKMEGTKGYHPGKVSAIQGNPGYRSYTIKFEDGSTNQVPVTKLLLMPKAPYDALPEIGTYVYSRVARDSPMYEKGIVHNKEDRIYVNHLNGNKFSQDPKNIGFVIRNIVPLTSSLRVGQEVIAQVDSNDRRMFMGVIREVIQGPKLKKYLVEFTDGSKKKLTPGRIRIIPTYGTTEEETIESQTNLMRREQLVVEVEGVSLRIEGYLGGQLEPMLRFDSKLTAEVYDWSKKLSATAFTSLQASYYNDFVAEWEPLIEPIIENNRDRPWLLNINYVTEDDDVQAGDSSANDVTLLQKPMTSLKLQSNDNLEVTITKSGLSLLQDLGKAFGEAVEQTADVGQVLVIEKDPFILHNKVGKGVTVAMNDLIQGKNGGKVLTLEPSSQVGLKYTEHDVSIRRSGQSKLPTLSITVDGFMEIKNVAVKRQKTVIYDLISTNILGSSASYSLIIQVTATDGQRVITLRSPLQIRNHFPMPLDVSYLNKENRSVKLTSIDAGSIYSIPLVLAYHSSFYIKPAGFGYNVSTEAISWSDLLEERQKQYVCTNPVEDSDDFYVQVIVENDVYSSIHGMLESVPRYTLHCYPPIVLHNYLPYPIFYRAKGMSANEKLEGGSHWPLFTLNVEEKPVVDIELEYLGIRWCGSIIVSECKNNNSKTARFSLFADGDKRMELGVYYLQEGSLHATLYCPYWMLNKTGKSLIYEAIGESSSYEHADTNEGAVMFFVRGKKKKARVCVSGCDWSNPFSLDTIGSGGSLKSEGLRGRLYEIGVGISLSYFGLTKIVTFTPLRILSNHTKFTISMAEGESETAEWHTVKPDESVPYWPTRSPPTNLYLNINGKNSVEFNLEAGKTLLLKFQNEIGGVCLNYQEKDWTSLLSFTEYFSGAAPVRIENMCKKVSMISYKQVDHFKGYILLYGQSTLYTWDNPMKPHELLCSLIEVNESQTKIKLDTNDFGRMKTGENAIYWVSFLDGLQRVLLFTDNFKAAYCASQEQTLRPTQEIDLNIEGLGLSLVNGEKRMEIAYLAIEKSPIVWEQHKKNRWKTLPGRMCEALEEGYTRMQARKSNVASKEKILEMEVDFDKMFITKPQKIQIRRTFHSGIGFKYIISPNRMQISATISSLQFDSHIPGSTFSTVIHQVEPPKSITNDNAPKPFFELSLTTNVGDKNTVNEISYLKVLVQELDIRVDKGFLLALMDLFNNEKIRGTESDQHNFDMSVVQRKLEESQEFQAAKQDKRYVFNYFHLSPLKIHVSFSMTGGHSLEGEETSSSMHGNVLGLLLQSVGVAFTEIQDVEFKLACYEIASLLLSYSQLTDSIAKHYQNQAIKQLYVLVLGLDVLGNPYGLITGVGAGAKNFFYEPYQGLIQGPEEFAEGLAYGVKSLVGGTVGGVSGAVSKITGTVGKGLAALTMDDEYQQKRRQAMSQRPTNLGQGLAKGGKGLVKGIVSGVTGVVTKPIEGAKSGGAGGFFKGIGKGLIGVVARPAGGVVDMASSTFEGLKSTTSGVKSIHQLRVTRVFHADKVLRPFNEYEADGNKILMEADKGRYAKTDFYLTHVYPVESKNYLILSNKHIFYMTRNEILNEWTSSWCIGFNEIKGLPVMRDTRITFNLHAMDTRKSIFKKAHNVRTLLLPTEATAKWFLGKFEDAKML